MRKLVNWKCVEWIFGGIIRGFDNILGAFARKKGEKMKKLRKLT